jgi:hypothetical protein
MNITEILDILTESKEDKKDHKKAFKGRVHNYETIRQALSDGKYGEIFSTKDADRLYVISKGKWGAKSGRGKIAKGFTPGSSTPSSGWSSVKKHAARTLLRYGRASNKLAQKYGSRSIKAKRGIGGKDGREDK